MAQDTTKLNVEVGDGGTSQEVLKQVKDLNSVIKESSKSAREARKELKKLLGEDAPTGKGTAGSRKALDELDKYTKQRGVGGLRGAGARDFAAQAQGLDGLVRLYATYAANVFALGAAFRALGNAMDTQNMVKGLDQLGASVGRNLGGLSQRVSELTGGAISMREAMQAVALTSSGGMSAKNIERLAGVARSASLALGVAMPDAINRLSRGITKLEPELLDELGIMTRLDPATQAYARQLGKTVTQLTDFERRQAFANAVLAEGEAKFGAITDLKTNPYDQLISSLKNLAQEGAELINKVVAPLASFLSESPALLGGGVLALISGVVKKALPEIGEFKQKLSESVAVAAELAKTRAQEANEAEIRMTRVAKQQAEERADAQIAAVVRAEERIKALKNSSLREQKIANTVLNKLTATGSVDEFDLKALESAAKRREHAKKPEEAAAYREVTKAVKEYAAAHEAAVIQIQREEAAIIKQNQASKTSIAGLTRLLAIKAEEDAIKTSIVSNAAYNASLIGIGKASAIMKEEIRASTLNLTLWGRTVLQVQGYMAMFAGVISTVGSALIKLTNAISWIATIVSVFSILDHMFSGSRVELDKFKKSAESTEASLGNITRTIEHLERTMTSGTINGITSMANALDDLNSNVTDLVESFGKAEKELSSSVWNAALNEIAKIWGGDVRTVIAKNLVNSTRGALDILARSGLKEESEQVFKELLGINSLDVASLTVAISKLSQDGVERLKSAINSASTELSNSSSRIQNFKQATETATRAYQQFIQSTSNTSPLFRVGAALQNIGVSMYQTATASKLSLEEITAAINHISEVPEAGNIFGASFIENLIEVREEFMSQNKAISAYKKAINDLDKQINGSKFAQFQGLDPKVLSKQALEGVEQLKKLAKTKEEIEKGVTLLSEQQSEKARRLFTEGLNTSFAKGAELIRISLGQAMEKGAIAMTKATLAGLSGAERARAENAISKQELDIQLRAIQTNIDLILSQALLRASIDKSTAASNLASARQAGKSAQEIKALEAIEQASDIFYKIVKEGQSPNFANISRFTNDEEVAARVQVSGIADSQRLAEQNEAKVLLDAQRKALGISGAINIRSGQLEDTQKLLGLQQQVLQNDLQRINALNSMIGLTSVFAAKSQAETDRNAILLKQTGELLAIETAIANAGGNEAEVRKQEEYKLLTLSRHERELDLQNITSSQRIIQATIEALARQLELVRAINNSNYVAGIAQTDLLSAQNSAYNTLFGVSTGFAAIQAESVGNQRAQLEYVKLTSEAQLALYEKERKAKEELQRLDPIRDSARVTDITDELDRQNKLTKATITNAKVQLDTQTKILEISKKAALQQDRYNRILNNSTKAADSLTKAFGSFGTSLGSIAEAFANMTVNADKTVNELARIRKEQAGLSQDDERFIQLEKEYNTQRTQYTQDRLASYGAIAGASKNLFDEQSEGYRILMAVEKALYIAHIAMTLKQMAVDAMATETTITKNIAEAESEGSLAIIKSIASLPFPLNIAAGVAIAGIIGVLLASMGGSSPKVSGSVPLGSNAEEVQGTQGTGQRYINGVLSDGVGGALGSSEKVNDIANSLELIEKNTSLSSSFALKTILTLKAIEKNTKDLAADVFKSTNINKLSSGFGTIERAMPATSTGMLSGLFPSTSKSVEIVDKGISVIGKFSEILAGTAKALEYETTQITKTKSGFLGIGGKTKVSIVTNTKELNSQVEESITDLFSSLATSSIYAAKEVFGEANTKVEEVLSDFNVVFKASGMGLSGEEFAQAILAESSVIMNEIIAKAMPQLNEFRKLGEGFSGTLLRMATTVDVVSEKLGTIFNIDVHKLVETTFKVDGGLAESVFRAAEGYNDILNSLVDQALIATSKRNGKLVISSDQISALNTAENEISQSMDNIIHSLGLGSSELVTELNTLVRGYTQAKLAILDNVSAQKDLATVNKLVSGELTISTNARANSRAGITDEVINLYKATISLEKATRKTIDAFSDQNFITLLVYNNLVETMGGLEEFTKKTGYWTANFFTEAEQLASKTELVNSGLRNFAAEGVLTAEQLTTLTDGQGSLREEYRLIVESLDLLSTSGLQAYNTLMTFAPAITEISDPIQDVVKEVKEVVVKTLEEMLDEVGLSADKFSGIINSAILGDGTIEELGGEIANTIREGFINALTGSFVNSISEAFTTNILGPMLNSVTTWTTLDFNTASGNFTGYINTLTQNAIRLSNMLSSPEFSEALNIATTFSTMAIKKLITTLRNADNVFSNSKLLEYTSELADLEKELSSNSTSTTNVLQDSLDAEQTRLDLLSEQADVLKSSVEDLKNFNTRMVDFKNSLLIGPQSPLTPLDQYAEARRQLQNAMQQATSASTEEERNAARSRIEDLSRTFLDVSRTVYASGVQYTADFNYVQSILDSLISDSSIKLSIDEQQLAALNSQIDSSKQAIKVLEEQLKAQEDTNDNLQTITERIAELHALIAEEYRKGKDAVVHSFSIIDANFDNMLTADELIASGIATDDTIEKYLQLADTNSDGQISRLEALNVSSNNTYYTLQSMIPIFEAVRAGIISVDTGIQFLAELNSANIAKGGTGITGTYNPPGGGTVTVGVGTGGTPSVHTTLGGYISNGTVYGANGATIGVTEAQNALNQMIQDTANNTISARDVYNILQSWGASSSLVASILGTTQQEVLNWFSFYDSSIPAFAKGIDLVPEDMLAQIHKDERILPAADNRLLMQSLSNRNDTNLELITELRELNLKISNLEKVVAEGAFINAEATNRNTEEITKTMTDTSSVNNHLGRIQGKVALR